MDSGKGDLKSVDGSWKLEDLGDERTRATYSIEVDLGRTLGMLVRGPMVDMLRQMLAGARAGELKKRSSQAEGPSDPRRPRRACRASRRRSAQDPRRERPLEHAADPAGAVPGGLERHLRAVRGGATVQRDTYDDSWSRSAGRRRPPRRSAGSRARGARPRSGTRSRCPAPALPIRLGTGCSCR